MSLLKQVDATGRYIYGSVPPSLDRPTAVLEVAVLDSIKHIRGELRVASALSTTLLTAVKNAQGDRNHVSRHCSPPRRLCAEATALRWGENVLRTVMQDLSVLETLIDLTLDEPSLVFDARDAFLFTVAAIRENETLLNTLLLSVRDARQTAAMAMMDDRPFT